ncbi:hypothetical protein LTR10_010739 [Elasticomyces elasticus]|nr:hypothetical protein LTR10_010739 [Elasticomyces elasticus]KAK4968345.1 hypothetical protein LTR42_009628 [Elasticomyces elasticus]
MPWKEAYTSREFTIRFHLPSLYLQERQRAAIESTPPRALRRRQPFACEPQTTPSKSPLAPLYMPLVYHLHPTSSQDDFGISTPPASPGRTFISPHAKLTSEDMAGTTCDCGHEMFDSRGCCPACRERQQKRHHQLSGRNVSQTPPPSQPNSPRDSLDRGRPMSIISESESSRNGSPVAAAMNSAFGSQEDDDSTISMFPSHLYRNSRRASTRSPSFAPPRRTTTIRHSDDQLGPVVGQLARTNTPTKGVGSSEYSPMAAGFARINRAEVRSEGVVDERRMSQRGSMELAARMFDGPA